MNKFLPCLQSRAFFLSETQHSASAPCQRAVCQGACGSQITLWWRGTAVIVVCTLHPPPLKHIWRFMEESWAPAGHATRERDRRKEWETHQGMAGTPDLVWRTQCSGGAGPDYLATWGGQMMSSSYAITLNDDLILRKMYELDIALKIWNESHRQVISFVFCNIVYYFNSLFLSSNGPDGVVCFINQDWTTFG